MTGVWAIDRDALHRYLYRRADRFGRLPLEVKQLSRDLELGYCNLTEIIQEMTQEGRLVKLAGHRTGRKTFKVVDPVQWKNHASQVGTSG